MSIEKPTTQPKIEMSKKMMEESFVNLNGQSEEMAQEINKETGVRMINKKAQIKMSMWGGENIKGDLEKINEMKKKWCGLYDSRTRAFREEQYGTTDEKQIIARYSQDRQETKPALMESAVTVLLHKILHDRFLVVKSSEWDDYANGADNIIIDKLTGQIVGVFDEVDEEVTGQAKDRGLKKDKQVKIIEKALEGGSQIKYGLTYAAGEDGQKKLVKKSFANVPIFYLSLKLEHLGDLVESVGGRLSDKVSDKGLEFFDGFIASLEAQADLLQDKIRKNVFENKAEEIEAHKVSANIDGFRKSIAEMKNLRSKY